MTYFAPLPQDAFGIEGFNWDAMRRWIENSDWNFKKSFTVQGDIVSANWDGTDPLDLSAVDATATAGFAFDTSEGAAQFMGDIFLGGELYVTGGVIRLDAEDSGENAVHFYPTDAGGGGGFLGSIYGGDHYLLLASPYINSSANQATLTLNGEASPTTARILANTSMQARGFIASNAGNTATFLGNDGSGSAPTFSFSSDSDTGMYHQNTNVVALAAGGTTILYATSGALLAGVDGSATTPAWNFVNDQNTGMYRISSDYLGFTTGGVLKLALSSAGSLELHGTTNQFVIYSRDNDDQPVLWYNNTGNQMQCYINGERLWIVAGGSSSSLWLEDGLTDVGNHEVLRLDRGSGGTMRAVGYFSSWEFDPLTGRKAKKNITTLSKSPKWDRELFKAIRPVTFIRTSTKEREFGFRIEDWVETDERMRFLTTKGDKWGYSPDDTALLAVTVDYVQHLESRVAKLEQMAGIT